MTDMPDRSLAELVNVPATLTLAGETLTLTPLVMRDLPAFLAAIRPIQAALTGLDLRGGVGFAALQGALLAHPESALTIVTILARRERDWVEGLALDDFITLAARAFAVNGHFFMTRVVPTLNAELEGVVQALGRAWSAPGSTSPPASSAPATATAT